MSSSGLGNGSRVGELLECLVPHKLHDYITEGIRQALDGQHLLSVVRTGGGKTGYFYGFMLVLRALSRLPRTHPMAQNIPQHPKIVIIYPTKGLAEEMVRSHRDCKSLDSYLNANRNLRFENYHFPRLLSTRIPLRLLDDAMRTCGPLRRQHP